MYHHYEKTTLNDVKSRLLNSDEPDKEQLIGWIDTLVSKDSPRYVIDQQRMVLKYYYSVNMGGSNSIKDVLPAVLNESEALRQIYAQPYSGLSLKNKVLYQTDEHGKAINPYSYELNLVPADGSRVNVIGHGKKSEIMDDAQKLDEFLGKPVWNMFGL